MLHKLSCCLHRNYRDIKKFLQPSLHKHMRACIREIFFNVILVHPVWNFKMFYSSKPWFDRKIVFTYKIHRDETFESRSHVDMIWRFFFMQIVMVGLSRLSGLTSIYYHVISTLVTVVHFQQHELSRGMFSNNILLSNHPWIKLTVVFICKLTPPRLG